MLRNCLSSTLIMAGLVLATTAYPCHGQLTQDWTVFPDSQTNAECGVVNASNTELVVLFDTGNLATLSGIILEDLAVDIDNPNWPVTFEGQPAGLLTFATDGDGLPALFWVSLTGTVVGINTFDAEPFDGGFGPGERINTGCDVCELTDSPLCDPDPGPDIPDLPTLCGSGVATSTLMALVFLPLIGLLGRRPGL